MPSDRYFSFTWRDAVWLAALMGAFAILAWQAGLAAGAFEADPDYIYLLSGLQIVNLISPHYYTHPGTPVEMLAALVMPAAWLLRSSAQGISDAVLADPGYYLGAVNLLFTLLMATGLAVFALRLRRFAGMTAAMVGSLSIFLFLPAFLALHRVTPEPLLLASGLVLAGLIAPFAFGSPKESWRAAFFVGGMIGFCLALKVTAAPLLLLILIFRSWGARCIALAASAAAAIVFTLPVAAHYDEMLLWYLGLFTHQGGYGSGPAGLPPLSQFWANVQILFAAMPEVFACLAVYVAVLAARTKFKWRDADPASRVLLICTLLVAIDLVLVLKQPEPRYTVPAVAFLCLGNAALAKILLERFQTAWIGAAAVVLLAALGLWRESARLENLAAERGPGQALLEKTAASGCFMLPYYSVNMVVFDLYFGDAWNGFSFRDRLAHLYPDYMTFDGNHHVFPTFAGDLPPDQALARLAGHRCSYWVGSPLERFDDFGIPKDQFSLVARSPGNERQAVAVYRLNPGWHYSPK